MITKMTPFEPHRSVAYSRFYNYAEQWTIWSIWLLAAAGILREILGGYEMVRIGSFTLHCVDIPILCSAIAAILCLCTRGVHKRIYTIPVLIIVMIIFANAVRGLFEYPDESLQWIRFNTGTATVLLMSITCVPSIKVIDESRRAILSAAIILGIIIVLRLIFGPTWLMVADISPAEVNDGGRPLSAQGTFVIVFCSTLFLSDFLRQGQFRVGWRFFIVLLLPLLVFATRQGTASIAQLTSIVILLAIENRPRRGLKATLLFCFIGIAGISIWVVFRNAIDSQDLDQRIGNLNTRSAIWEALMMVWPTLPFDIQAFGYPAGGMPPLSIQFKNSYRLWEASIHSMYYGSLPVMGYIGLASFLCLMSSIFILTLHMPFARLKVLPAYPFALCVSSALLGYSYEIRDYTLLGLFVAITFIEHARLESRTLMMGEPIES